MRTISAFIAGFAALASLSASALAADLYHSGSLKDAPATDVQTSISGPYVEASIGPTFGAPRAGIANVTSLDLGFDGGNVNGRAGYDLLVPGALKRFGVGVWGEVGTSFDASGSALNAITWNQDLTYGFGGKVFYDHGSGQLYAIGGYAAADESITVGNVKSNKTLTGWEWGTGISLLLVKGVYGKLEFDQLRYNDEKVDSGLIKISQVDNRVLFGVGVSVGQVFAPLK
jgi:hypothetical protein